jgi:hypothetical protein
MPNTIPKQGVVDEIWAMPKFSADISFFTKNAMGAQAIAEWVIEQEGQVILNMSQANSDEKILLQGVRAILQTSGIADKLVLFDEAAKVDVITERITDEVISSAIEGFREFIRRALRSPDNFITEWNTYVAPRKDEGGFNTMHYWNNLGLRDQRNRLRGRVMALFEGIRSEFAPVIEERVLPRLTPNEHIRSTREQIDTLLLGMLSNMVRGIFYSYANAKKVYDMRKLAVDVLAEQGRLSPGTDTV